MNKLALKIKRIKLVLGKKKVERYRQSFIFSFLRVSQNKKINYACSTILNLHNNTTCHHHQINKNRIKTDRIDLFLIIICIKIYDDKITQIFIE